MMPTSILKPTSVLFLILTHLCGFTLRSCDGSTIGTADSDVLSSMERMIPEEQEELLSTANRRLVVGDFDRINTLIKDMVLSLEDQSITAGELNLAVTNLQCQNINIGDVLLNYTVIESALNDTLRIALSAFPFNMECSADYSFDAFVFNGRGSFSSTTENNGVDVAIDLIAPNGFDSETPSISDVSQCAPSINVVDTTFSDGGIITTVLNLLKEAISGIISNQADLAVCNIMEELGVTFFSDLLNSTSKTFDTWLQPIPVEDNDPLFAERNYVPPEGVTLLTLNSNNNVSFSTTGSIGEFVVSAITNAESLLDRMVDDPTSPTGTTLEINVFLRDNFLDDNGTYTIQFDDFEVDNSGDFNPVLYDSHDKLSKTSIRINAVSISGLDTMTSFRPLIELGEYTFLNELGWENLSILVDLTVSVESSQVTDPILVSEEPIKVVENITVSLDLEQLNVNASLFIAIDQNKFDSLPLGSLLKDPVICFLSALDTMEVSGLEVSLGQFSDLVIDGFESPGVSRVVKTLIEAAFFAYEPTLLRIVPYFFQVPVRNIFKNDIINQFLGENNECLSRAQEIPETSVIDFRDLLLPTDKAMTLGGSGTAPYGNLMHAVLNFVKEEYLVADPTTGLASVNSKFLSDIAMDQSGTPGRLFFPGNFFNQTREVRTNGRTSTLRLRLYDIYLNNIDTFGVPLTILEPVQDEPHLLDNEASVGVYGPLRLGFRFFIGISNAENDIENDVEIFLDFTSLQTMVSILARVSERAFMIFPLHDIFNLRCWLATIQAPELDDVGFRINDDEISLAVDELIATVSALAFNISCIKCTGPRVPELSELFSGLKNSDDVTAFANGIFNYGKDLASGEVLQIATDRAVNDAKYQCPHSDLYDANYVRKDYGSVLSASSDESTISFFWGLIIVLACLLVATVTFVLITKYIVRRRHEKWIASLPKSHLRVLHRQQALQKETNQSLDSTTVSMVQSGSIPVLIRILVPIVILGNIALFLSGHLSLAANVSLSASLAGQSFRDEDLFEFSVADSTIELWKAGGRGLAMIIFLLSFAWPYSKQLIVLGLWFAPPSTVSVSTRGSTLLWLDILGKWSIVDIFVLVMVLVGFRISIQSPDLEFLPDGFYSIDLLVAPRWGLYSNMIAQILSQISSHYIIHYHRRIVFNAAPHLDPTRNDDIIDCKDQPSLQTGTTDRLVEHAFTRPHRGQSDKLISRSFVNPMLYLLAILSSAFVVVGCIVPTFSLNKLGLIGLLVEAGQSFDAAYNRFSVFSTISTIIEQASVMGNIADYVGLSSLSALMVLSVLIVPMLQATVLLVQWFAPLTRRRRFRLMVTLEALQAWQYMEVYLLALLIASWQLGEISAKLINPYCSALEEIFRELTYYGILNVEDAQCYRSDIGLEPTFYILLVAAVILAVITSFVSRAVNHYFRDKDPHQNPFLYDKSTTDIESESGNNILEDTATIQPTPVLFTDRYRWFLQRESATRTNDFEETISNVKSRGSIAEQNTSTTIDTPESLSRVESERNIDTVADSDEDDIYVDENPVSQSQPTGVDREDKVLQSNVAEPSTGDLLGTGAIGSMVRRGYDVDEDEWIVESVSENVGSGEKSAFLIEGTSTIGSANNTTVAGEAFHKSTDSVSICNGAVVVDEEHRHENNDFANDAHLINEVEALESDNVKKIESSKNNDKECNLSSLQCTETTKDTPDTPDTPTFVESKDSDASLNGVVFSSPEVQYAVSNSFDDKWDKEILPIPSSCNDILFDDAPASPASQTKMFESTAISPKSDQSTMEDIAPTSVVSDRRTGPMDPEATTNVVPAYSDDKSESDFITSNDLLEGCDIYGTDCTREHFHSDAHSVGSDQTPSRVLQMN